MDRFGCIMSADSETAIIFQYDEEELEEADIAMLVPAIKLPGSDEALTKVTMMHKTAAVKLLMPLYCMFLLTDQFAKCGHLFLVNHEGSDF